MFASFQDIESGDRVFVLGTTLATFSAFRYGCFPTPPDDYLDSPSFRLIRHALELKKPVLMLNVGPTRADGMPGIEKIELTSGSVLRGVVRAVL